MLSASFVRHKLLGQHVFHEPIGWELVIAVAIVALSPELDVAKANVRYFTSAKCEFCQARFHPLYAVLQSVGR